MYVIYSCDDNNEFSAAITLFLINLISIFLNELLFDKNIYWP